AQRHRRGTDFLQKQLQAQRMEMLAIVTAIRFYSASCPARLKLDAAAILVHALPGLLVNEFNLRAINLIERHPWFARLDLRLERIVELVKRSFFQIDDLRQAQVVEMLEMIPQRGVDLGLARGRIENIIVAHTFLLREFN